MKKWKEFHKDSHPIGPTAPSLRLQTARGQPHPRGRRLPARKSRRSPSSSTSAAVGTTASFTNCANTICICMNVLRIIVQPAFLSVCGCADSLSCRQCQHSRVSLLKLILLPRSNGARDDPSGQQGGLRKDRGLRSWLIRLILHQDTKAPRETCSPHKCTDMLHSL